MINICGTKDIIKIDPNGQRLSQIIVKPITSYNNYRHRN